MNSVTVTGPKTFYSTFATEIMNIAPEASRKSFSLFLNCQQRSTLLKVCVKIKSMSCYSMVDPRDLMQEFAHGNLYLSLEELWTLQFSQIMSLEIYLTNLDPEILDEFKKSICEMYLFDAEEDLSKEFVQTGMVSYFVRKAVDNCDGAIKEISNCIIRSFIKDIFSLPCEDQNDKRVRILYSLFKCGTIEKSSLYIFSINILTYFTNMSYESVFEALAIQENCYNNENPFQVCSILQKIMQNLDPHCIENLLFKVLLSTATNWKHFVVLVKAFIKTHDQATTILSKHIGEILKKSLQTFDESNFQKAILIGRQSLLAVNPANSYPAAYKQWFMIQFGNLQLLKNPQSFSFFLQVLSELIPYEKNVEILKVCLECVFPVPGECQSAYSDYKALLKTRINDLEPRVQPEDVIDKLLAVYEQSGKIPSYVLEVSLVRKHYFLNEFLPVLLSPRVVPTIPDLRSRFIEDLDKAGKIPSQLLQKYRNMCNQMKQSQLLGR